MEQAGLSRRVTEVMREVDPFYRFATESTWARHAGDPADCDFVFGNPHELPLPGFVSALQRYVVPQNEQWFAYKLNEAPARAAVAESLRRQHSLPFQDEDVFLTTGAFAAIAISLSTLVDPGDEVIYVSPPWFYYSAMITGAGARPVRVQIDPRSFDLDVDAIEAALSERTRAVIINSPHNPTGKIYPPATLERLAQCLSAASERYGRPIYVLSDEAYNRIIFDDRTFHTPANYYANTFIIYTYGKTLLTPGQRVGYIALPPAMPGREELRSAIFAAQVVTGFAFPNALLQYAIPELEQLSIDVGQLQRRRDRLAAALQEMGYELTIPEATFYMLVRCPGSDDLAFSDLLAAQRIFCLPGSVAELPGYIRLSLTANDDMIERSLPGFAAALEQARLQGGPARE